MDTARVAVSCQFGPWAGLGIAADGAINLRMKAQGVGLVTSTQGLIALDAAMRPNSGAVFALLPIKWRKFLSGSAAPSILTAFETDPTTAEAAWAKADTAKPSLSLGAVLEMIDRTAGGNINADAPLMEASIDSLGAVELHNLLQGAIGDSAALSATFIFDHPTARQLANTLMVSSAVKARSGELLLGGAAIEVSGVGTQIPLQRWDVSSSLGHLSEAQNDSVQHGGFDGPDHGDTKVFTGTSSIRLRGGGYFIRRASLEDIPYLAALDTSLWPALLSGLTEDEIRALIQTFEAGQLVLCASSGDLVGSLYTQRVASDDALLFDTATFRDALALHQDSGSVWQLLSVQVTPILMSRGLGDVLINYALTVARASPGVHKVVAVTRCRTWAQKGRQQPTLEEHLEMGTGPGLVFHTARGALVPNKRPEHLANGGVRRPDRIRPCKLPSRAWQATTSDQAGAYSTGRFSDRMRESAQWHARIGTRNAACGQRCGPLLPQGRRECGHSADGRWDRLIHDATLRSGERGRGVEHAVSKSLMVMTQPIDVHQPVRVSFSPMGCRLLSSRLHPSGLSLPFTIHPDCICEPFALTPPPYPTAK